VMHVPFTLYLNSKYVNAHSTAAAARSLRIFSRFVDAFNINVAARALEGRCLSEGEKKALRQLVYYDVKKVEAMSDHVVRRVGSATKAHDAAQIKGSVESNTAEKQLVQIADFLMWFQEKVLESRMPLTSPVTERLRRAYASCANELKKGIGGTKSDHPHRIRSVPNQRFLEIYRAIFSRAGDVLQTGSGKPGSNLMRDRAMVLLAAEGLRPGGIGNIALADFKWAGGKEHGHIRIRDNTTRRKTRLTTATPTQKGARSSQGYNSEGTISIWPTTASAIQAYIDGDRQAIASRTLRNLSLGFLFLAEHGGPIGDRSTISIVFKRAGAGLRQLGLLAKDAKDPYLDGEEYDFCAYLLRHSAATMFYANKIQKHHDNVVQDLMRARFFWAPESTKPSLYARRAMADAASLTLEDFMDSLLKEATVVKKAIGAASK
jgi:integrase